MRHLRLTRTLQLTDDLLRQNLPQLHAPLIERVDTPDRSLREHSVLIQRDQLPQHLRSQLIRKDRIR